MATLDENHYLRKYYIKHEEVPTQSVMMAKMSPPLAKVYFKSMTPKLKILAGLEPPMKGGGSDWFVPPSDLLQSKAVLKPVKKEYLSKLGFDGIAFYGETIVKAHQKQMEETKRQVLQENDLRWKRDIELACRKLWEDKSKEAAQQNTSKIRQAFHEFRMLFSTSLNKIEELLLDASIKEIQRVKEAASDKMSKHYEILLKQQATMLYDRYTERLAKENERHKSKFIENLEKARINIGDRIHDINVEKHIAIEKLRCLLESQNLACQIYVALKEREECKKEMKLSKHEHEKRIKLLNEEIAIKGFEIRLAHEKEKKRHEFNTIWLKKICHVVKRFQDFVCYCLNALPEHAEFFINMEKLMLLQLSEAIENPEIESVFIPEEEPFHTPIPRPHPFYLFCDKGYKPQVEQNLCPKHCTSSASQLPVVVVNKQCIYSACDNLEVFADKIKGFIDGRRGDDTDFEDDHDYTYDIPVKYTPSQQMTELKMENSLMQVLQKEFPNVKEVPIECCLKKVPFCFCSPVRPSTTSVQIKEEPKKVTLIESLSPGETISTRDIELEHERQPKWESYLKYIKPRRCKCAKIAKKHLQEHLPSYMRTMSMFEAPEIPHYEPCSLKTLKKLVRKARGIRTPPPEPEKAESKTRDISTQYSDQEFDFLCTCFSDDEVDKLFNEILKEPKLFTSEKKFKVVDGCLSPSNLTKHSSTFATERAISLKQLLDDTPELKEIFRKDDCKF
ncbi:uncharacterized protein [Epargyreus clarus]|uniref:uncharacterized protein n=1 Tax=Epargyreus clarus TaxID=520877 RepID=UPI003C2D59E6